MHRRSFIVGAGAAGAAAVAGPAGAQVNADRFVGEWGGAIDAGGQRLRIRMVIVREGDGVAITGYSLDQDDRPIEARDVRVDGDRLSARFPTVRGRYSGVMVAPRRIEGTWSQGGDIPLDLERDPDFDALAIPAPREPLTQTGLEALRAAAGSPAMAAAASGPGGEAAFASGLRSLAGDAAVTTNDLWHLGSITKSFTATLVARLVEAGAVSWDETVGDRLGAVAPDMRESYRAATYRHLLSHRAGLKANISPLRFARFPREEDDARASREDYARIALGQEPEGPAEETFLYSNNGYVIAGAMLEAAMGESWERLIRAHVFEPLGLETAGFGAPGTPGALDQPVGHAPGVLAMVGLGARRRPHPPGAGVVDNPAVLGPAGRAHMSLADLLAYLAAHRDRATAFLAEQSWETLHTPPYGGGYAMGWTVRPDGALWHNGSNTLWYAEALVDPARGAVAAAAANDGMLAHAAPQVGEAMMSALAAVTEE